MSEDQINQLYISEFNNTSLQDVESSVDFNLKNNRKGKHRNPPGQAQYVYKRRKVM